MAVLVKKVWVVDALKCPKCGGRMKIISLIEQPPVIRRILEHLDFREDPKSPPQPLELVCEPCTDYIQWQVFRKLRLGETSPICFTGEVCPNAGFSQGYGGSSLTAKEFEYYYRFW